MKKAYILVSREIIVFPSCVKEINVGRKRSLEAIEAAYKKNKQIVITAQTERDVEEPTEKDIYNIGTLCEIQKMERNETEGDLVSVKLTVKGVQRVRLSKYNHLSAQPVIEYETLKSTNISDNENTRRIRDIFGLLDSKILANINETNEASSASDKSRAVGIFSGDADKLSDLLANSIDNFSVPERQNLLSTLDVAKRLDTIAEFLKKHAKAAQQAKDKDNEDKSAEFQQIDRKITKKINDNLSKQQREFYLRERLKAIKEELGDISTKEDDLSELREKLNSNPYPKHIKEKVTAELNRYEATVNSQENSIIRTYVEWLLDIPWWQEGKDNEDIKKVSKVLDKNHYGLQKVKERIVEYLAVLMRTKKIRGPIMCLVGPPGVGKSSLAKSIAESLGKEFVKMSLGGVHDESEIRGHRKTYIGSMPGRIIKGMKKAKVVNPLFLLDEIDKMTSDNHGDPASALLEVLDPELNNKFNDNYIEEDYDLSKVMFVATANYAEGIPEALYDRMEIIELTSYTEQEKLAIAKNYLIPRTLENVAMSSDELNFTDEAISYIIKHFTLEAGVRQLERTIQQIARKFLVRSQKDGIKTQKIDVKAVKFYLKKEIFDYTVRDEDTIPGIVNGMAYTSSGGDLLPIEVSYSPGKGELTITGNLKETMRESANVALGYVKSNAKEFGIDPKMFKTIDLHIHVPSGGIPKDGPSAGVALTTAIISALTGKKIDPTVAMTGEITLRGKVLVIGGVKEKTISAHRGGVRTIFMPEKDERYLDEVPKEIKDDLSIIFVKKYNDIFKRLFK